MTIFRAFWCFVNYWIVWGIFNCLRLPYQIFLCSSISSPLTSACMRFLILQRCKTSQNYERQGPGKQGEETVYSSRCALIWVKGRELCDDPGSCSHSSFTVRLEFLCSLELFDRWRESADVITSFVHFVFCFHLVSSLCYRAAYLLITSFAWRIMSVFFWKQNFIKILLPNMLGSAIPNEGFVSMFLMPFYPSFCF